MLVCGLIVLGVITPVLINNKIDEYDRSRRRDIRQCTTLELATCPEPDACMRVDCFKVRRVPAPYCFSTIDPTLEGEVCDDGDEGTYESVCNSDGICQVTNATAAPTASPTPSPTAVPAPPTPAPTDVAPAPSELPTDTPTLSPTDMPALPPTFAPSPGPTPPPSSFPTDAPTPLPTQVPTTFPTPMPTAEPDRPCGPLEELLCPTVTPGPCREPVCIIIAGAVDVPFCDTVANTTANGVSCDDGNILTPVTECFLGFCLPPLG